MAHADSLRASEEQQRRRPEKSHFRPDIEGLRAVAVTAVVLFHAAVPGIGGGYVGVDVFFVISGFLITGLLWREVSGTGTVRLRAFYGARARRLLPASAMVGVVTMIASAMLLPPLLARPAISDGVGSALYVSNYQFLLRGVDYFSADASPSPFLHYWSLGVEEQFYLVWAPLILGTALVIRLVRRNRERAVAASRRPYLWVLGVVLTLSFLLSLQVTAHTPAAAFFSLPTRAWQLAAGGLVALTALGWQRLSPRLAAIAGWAGLGMIVLACVWFTSTTPFPGTAALLPTIGAVLVIGTGCATPSQGCGQFLGTSPMRAIGRISYSWYLWHWPVMVLAPFLLGEQLGLAARCAAAVVSAGLAWLTVRYLENPLRFAPAIRNSAWRSLGVGAVATLIAVAVGLGLLKAVPVPVGHGAPAALLNFTGASVEQTFAQVQAAVIASANMKAVPSNLAPPLADASAEFQGLHLDGCLRNFQEVGQPECATGDTASTMRVALIGDSTAAMWNPAFQQVATHRQWRLETLAKGGCPVMDLPIISYVLHRRYTECEQWRTEIVDRLRAERPQLIVVSMMRRYGSESFPSGFTAYDPAWLDSITRLTRQLREIGAHVLVLGPIPDPGSVVPVCLSGHLDDATACAPTRSAAVNPSGIAAEAAAVKAGGAQYADLTDLFCTTERCPVIVGNTLVYLDQNHVTLDYSRALAPAIAALADRALAHS